MGGAANARALEQGTSSLFSSNEANELRGRWDAVQVKGSLDARDASVSFTRGGRRLAVATVSRDRESLEAEVELERATESH